VRTSNDNKVAPSVEDKQFLSLMKSDFQQDDTGHWSAPLPFKQPKPPMPNVIFEIAYLNVIFT
jgi:hypothetical protein